LVWMKTLYSIHAALAAGTDLPLAA